MMLPLIGLFYRSDNKYDKNKSVHLNIYFIKMAEINQNKIALPLQFNMQGFSTLHPAISPNGKRLFLLATDQRDLEVWIYTTLIS